MDTDHEVRLLAGRFRQAIKRCAREDLPTFRDFPCGSCGDASILLGEYLYRRGHGVWNYAGGERENDLHSHAWLEKDGLILDITADQFDSVDEEVIFTRDPSWHRQVIYREPAHPALLKVYDENTRTNLGKIFSRIIDVLEGKMNNP